MDGIFFSESNVFFDFYLNKNFLVQCFDFHGK